MLFAENPPEAVTQAELKLKEHDLNGAWDIIHKAAAQKPESPGLSTVLGALDYLRGDIADAEMDFKRSLRLDDKFGRAWLGLGRVFEAAYMREKAKTCYRNAWKFAPGDPEIQRYYARTLEPAERLAAYEGYLAKPAPEDDSDTLDRLRRQVEELKWEAARPPFVLTSPMKHDEVKLSWLTYGPTRIRGFSLPVSFNGGKTLHLLMDSGAGGIVLNRKAAEAASLTKITDLKFGGIGDEGDRTGYTAAADTVRVGEVTFEHCPIAVSERKFLTDEDGLIGLDIFSRFLVTVDFQKLVLKLDPLPALKTASRDESWRDREIPSELNDFSPFFRTGHNILLPTRVNDGKPVLFLIDTGASSSLIDPEYARQFTGVRSEDLVRMRGVSGKVDKVQSAGQLTFQFGHYRQPVPGVLAIPLDKITRDSPRITGIFGVTTLALFRLQIDYRDGLLNLEYIGPKY